MNNFSDDLFDEELLDKQSKPVEKTGTRGQDGLYRFDMSKLTKDQVDKKLPYKARLRFLPNFTNNPELVKVYTAGKLKEGQELPEVAMGVSFLEKVTHFLSFKNESLKSLNGYYDAPTNINPYTGEKIADKSPLGSISYNLKDSTNPLDISKRKAISYSKKYFSYVLVIEDKQQPELEGKIMVFSYTKDIKDLIDQEDKEGTNIFSFTKGKDFTLKVAEEEKRIEDKLVKVPSYTGSTFSEERTTLPIAVKNDETLTFKRLPVDEDGRVSSAKARQAMIDFLLNREHELESFGAKPWSDEQEAKINQAINYLTGKSSALTNTTKSNPLDSNDTPFENDDFESDDLVSTSTSNKSDSVDDDLDF